VPVLVDAELKVIAGHGLAMIRLWPDHPDIVQGRPCCGDGRRSIVSQSISGVSQSISSLMPYLQASSTWQVPALIPELEPTSAAVALQRHAEMVRPDLQAEFL
jgi:hypothetical protein